jgi:sucrose-6-phosphate hydrolase SacC (GH32 family)
MKLLFDKIRHFLRILYRRYWERPLNQLHCYDYVSQNNGWEKYGCSPVLGNSMIGVLYDPYVFLSKNGYNMVVSSRKNGSLLLFESKDGIRWDEERQILTGDENSWDCFVDRACLLIHKGVYYLWYSGQRDGVSCIGLAKSVDGVSFCRVQVDPVLKSDSPQEGVSVMNPCVLWDDAESLFKMWYSAGDTYEPDVICYAESTDGISWKKHKAPVLSKCLEHAWEKYKVGGCCVLKNNDGMYEIYYIGYQNLDVARICVAHSKDGVCWTRDEDNLLLSPSKNAWDSDAVYKPSVLNCGGRMYLWYNGRRSCEEYIGLAIKELKNEM